MYKKWLKWQNLKWFRGTETQNENSHEINKADSIPLVLIRVDLSLDWNLEGDTYMETERDFCGL